jgi:hypothetical protein
MARKVVAPKGLTYPTVDEEKVKPNCGHCKGTEFTYALQTFGGTPGVLVYCQGCGAVVGWGPKKGKD